MSPGASKLNPNAEEYVPLAKRVGDDSSKEFEGSGSHDAGVLFHPEEGHSSLSHENGEDVGNKDGDGQLEMDLAYLQNEFPTLSEESLIDFYFVNECDSDATYDMLHQLESLPDSLDIGDVTEPQILPEFANLKLKEVEAATGSVSPCSPENAQPQS